MKAALGHKLSFHVTGREGFSACEKPAHDPPSKGKMAGNAQPP